MAILFFNFVFFNFIHNCFKNSVQARCWWLIPIILTTWESEIRKNVVPGQPGQNIHDTPNSKINNKSKMDWRCGSSGGAPALGEGVMERGWQIGVGFQLDSGNNFQCSLA
jgi:hypothetical protein